MKRTIDDVLEILRDLKIRNKKCGVLIGAGCSKSAGIPTATELIGMIKKRYPRAYERAGNKTYSECMSNLTTDQQRDLIYPYIENAKINWGHIALAQLMSAGYVDRVLTTNFDSLMVRACALLGHFPAVYDFAISEHFKPELIQGNAVFHLHGQYSGFIHINTTEKSAERAKLFESVINDTGRNRVWVIVGYSGESDPVFEQLTKIQKFDNGLFWIGYLDNEPAQHIRDRLLGKANDAYYVNGFDADNFFVTIARKLGCFPPDFVQKPFSYLENMLESLSPYKIPQDIEQINFMEHIKSFVTATKSMVEPYYSDFLEAYSNYLGGHYEKVIALSEKYKYPKSMPPLLDELIASSYLRQGDELVEKARIESGDKRDA